MGRLRVTNRSTPKDLEGKLEAVRLRSQAAADALQVEIDHLKQAAIDASNVVSECNEQIDELRSVRSRAFDIVADNTRLHLALEALRTDYLSS